MPSIDRTIGNFHDRSNSYLRKIGKYTGPNPYATGGDSFLPSDLGLGVLEHLDFGTATNGTLFRTLVWRTDTQKVMWIDATNGTEIANGTDLSGYTVRFEAVGR